MKLKIVKRIPGADRATRDTSSKLWNLLKSVPQGQYLEIKATPKERKLVRNHLYYRSRTHKTPINFTSKPKAMYVSIAKVK